MGLSKEPVVITADVRDGTAARLLILSPQRPELGKSVCALVRAVLCCAVLGAAKTQPLVSRLKSTTKLGRVGPGRAERRAAHTGDGFQN